MLLEKLHLNFCKKNNTLFKEVEQKKSINEKIKDIRM